MIAAQGVSLQYGGRVLFNDVNINFTKGNCYGLIGANGAGKSTFLKILAGELEPNKGSVFITPGERMAVLKQDHFMFDEFEVVETVLYGHKRLYDIMKEKEALYAKEDFSDEDGIKVSELEGEFAELDGWSAESNAEILLNGLGVTNEFHYVKMKELTGTQKVKVLLAQALFGNPDILLLDEPTNHLDIASIEWLEDFLKTYDGSVLIISHDRYFLDKIVTKVVEIENRKSTVYNGNYTAYMNQKAINRDIQQKAYENQQRELKRQEEVIRTLKAFNREKSIKRAESREKQLEKIERIDRPDSLPSHMRLTLTPRIISGSDVLHAEELSKSYGGQRIFRHVNLDIKRGETVAIIGPNGVGKSTLFKMLLGEVPSDSGLMRFGTNVHVGYYDQEQQKLDSNKTIFDEISDTYPTLTAGEIRNMLAAFVFTEDDVFKQVSSLSGGEKGRVSLAKIMLSKANLLMLDEPTNHLDMFSKEVLEDALNRYEGTVVYISHDRYFINKTAQIILELSPEGITRYEGNYDYYLEKKAERARKEALLAAEQPTKGAAPAPVQTMTDTKSDWLKQKEQQAAERKLAAKIAKVEKAIEETEAAIAKADEDMAAASSDYAKAQEIFEEKTKLEEKLEGLYEEWEGLHA